MRLKFLLCFVLLTACATKLPTDLVELQRTWDRARVYAVSGNSEVSGFMGDKNTLRRLSQISAGERSPTVVFMHGCAGLRWGGSWSFFERLARSGYVIIAPDSFARSYRPKLCGSSNAWKDSARFSEIRFAVEQIAKLNWVDQRNLFLMGHSEGGEIVGAYRGDEFKGRVVTGANCWRGVSDPSSTMAVVARGDIWTKGRSCEGVKKKIYIDGAMHKVLDYRDVPAAIIGFLENLRNSDQPQ